MDVGWFNSLSISASGLSAQQLRMDVISNNIANAQTTRTATGGPYRREMVVLQPNSKVTSPSFSDWLQMGASTPFQGQGGGVRVAGIL
jgi:flagellar basal-body rod protein FlgC